MEEYYSFFTYHPVVGAWIVPAAIAAASLIGNWISSRAQKKSNQELAEFQASANERYLKNQLDYNTPQQQMLRFQEAGLNPNLVYGQGNPGNQSAALSYPDVKPPDLQAITANLGPLVNQSLMTQSQTSAIDAKTNKTYVETQLAQLQKRVLEKNPLLDDVGFKAIIDGLVSTARIKESDAKIKGLQSQFYDMTSFQSGQKFMHEKMFKELDLLNQRYDLGNLDATLKSQVIKSKDFQNALQEIQVRWMKDADITPQHVYQFIQLLLLKLL